MIDLRQAKRIAVIGGGTAGWFAALSLRRIFSPAVEILVLEDPNKGIIGVGEGGLLNFVQALHRNQIDVDEFVRETGAAFKLGFVYEGWRSGGRQDLYYHLFPMVGEQVNELEFVAFGIMPLLAARVSAGADLHSFFPGFSLIADNASQLEARAVLATKRSGIGPSYHFDSYKVANYLKTIAQKRGIRSHQAKVDKLLLTPEGLTYALQADGEEIPVDFVVDASGLRRIGIGETYKEKWRSFSDYLILDRALPFHMPHPGRNPALVTRAIAMDAGWMWQIPLQERVGAGYVFSSKHISEENARREAERYVGHSIEPQPIIQFEPGNFERVWRNNVVAVGLASGFVEPLEATSIGQMLEELRNIEKILIDGRGVIGFNTIDSFNRSNHASWNGICDFLRMHYDGGRQDTRFWRDVLKLPRSDRYQELRACFDHRLPRMMDIENYVGNGWAPIFHMVNWLLVGAPLDVVTRRAGASELLGLPANMREQMAPYMAQLQNATNIGRNSINDFQDAALVRQVIAGQQGNADFNQR